MVVRGGSHPIGFAENNTATGNLLKNSQWPVFIDKARRWASVPAVHKYRIEGGTSFIVRDYEQMHAAPDHFGAVFDALKIFLKIVIP